jgi:hypothetical protein
MNRTIGGFILYIATALYLLAAGVIGIFSKGGEFYAMVSSIFGGGSFSTIIAVILALAAIAAGTLLLLQFFGIEFGVIEIILIAFAVLWIVFIIVSDIIVPLRYHPHFFDWLRTLAGHLVVLGAIATGTKAFGGGN